MARKTKEEAEKTYHALLDAATELFTIQGVSKTTLNDIAKSAGMTRGAVYWHFPNKDAVIMALWERDAGHIHDELLDSLRNLSDENPAEQFTGILKELLHSATNDPKLTQSLKIITSSLEFTQEASELQSYLLGRKNELYDALMDAMGQLQKYGVVRPTCSLKLLSTSLWSYVIGMIDTHLEMDSDKVDIKHQSGELIDLWLQAVFV